jgi:hypothetical protein
LIVKSKKISKNDKKLNLSTKIFFRKATGSKVKKLMAFVGKNVYFLRLEKKSQNIKRSLKVLDYGKWHVSITNF